MQVHPQGVGTLTPCRRGTVSVVDACRLHMVQVEAWQRGHDDNGTTHESQHDCPGGWAARAGVLMRVPQGVGRCVVWTSILGKLRPARLRCRLEPALMHAFVLLFHVPLGMCGYS